MDEIEATTRDRLFDGRLLLEQPARGHRSGTDAVLLAAAVSDDFSGTVLDVGAGVGAVGLGIALRARGARVTLLEGHAATAELARSNIGENEVADRVDLLVADIFAPGLPTLAAGYDLVVTNPPFFQPRRMRSSPSELRRIAHTFQEGENIRSWIAVCLACTKSNGTLAIIDRAETLPAILAALHKAGGITAKPIHARDGAPAHRVVVRAVRGSRAPFTLAAPLILHGNGSFTSEAEALHRGRSCLAW